MRHALTLTVLTIGLFSACSKEKPPPMTPAAGTTQAIDQAITDMANARCDHEQRCNQIGANAKYSDRNHCIQVMGGKAREDLQGCVRGVDQEDMRQCMTEISNQSCDGMFSGIAESKACGMDDLCAD